MNETRRHLHYINDLKHPKVIQFEPDCCPSFASKKQTCRMKQKALGVTNAVHRSQISSVENEVMNLKLTASDVLSVPVSVFSTFFVHKGLIGFMISAFMCFPSVWRWFYSEDKEIDELHLKKPVRRKNLIRSSRARLWHLYRAVTADIYRLENEKSHRWIHFNVFLVRVWPTTGMYVHLICQWLLGLTSNFYWKDYHMVGPISNALQSMRDCWCKLLMTWL